MQLKPNRIYKNTKGDKVYIKDLDDTIFVARIPNKSFTNENLNGRCFHADGRHMYSEVPDIAGVYYENKTQ